jgi:phospholipid transport system substrate-binding protein
LKSNQLTLVLVGMAFILSSPSSFGESERETKEIFPERSLKGTKEVNVKSIEGYNSDPFDLIDTLTVSLLAIISKYKNAYPTKEEVFFETIMAQMSPHVDFWRMSRSVMGSYRTEATEKQLLEFTEVFRKSMVETYGRGLLSFNDEKINIINRREISADEVRVSVKQEIHSSGKVYPLSYSMKKNEDGAWIISNVVIDGINLGKTLRNQFRLAAQKNNGNLDVVIKNWLAETN